MSYVSRIDFQLCRRQAAILDQIWTGIHSAWSPCRNFPSLRCCLSGCWRKPRKITLTGGFLNPTELLRVWCRSEQRESVQVLSRLLVGINETQREVDLVELNEQENEGGERGKLLSRLARAIGIGIRWEINRYCDNICFFMLLSVQHGFSNPCYGQLRWKCIDGEICLTKYSGCFDQG